MTTKKQPEQEPYKKLSQEQKNRILQNVQLSVPNMKFITPEAETQQP